MIKNNFTQNFTNKYQKLSTPNFEYDYIIVGAGLFGAVFSFLLNQKGKKCLVIDKRKHIGGNIFCENIESINVHKYGPHIFHTSNKKIWDFVNTFVDFNRFTYSPLACYKDKLYNLPFNMNTFKQLWKTAKPEHAKKIINDQRKEFQSVNPKNLEEQALKLVGEELYQYFIKGYTEKQWGRNAKDLPVFIINRIPIRFTFDNNYFDDLYQGIPIGGYNTLINKLFEGIEVKLSTEFFENKELFENNAKKILFTGRLDEFYNYAFGELDYRSLSFETEILALDNYQGNAAINYTERDIPFTRIIEHKHFEFGQQSHTVITKEYPAPFTRLNEPFYPINDATNNKTFSRYKEKGGNQKKYIFGGRLADYQYYDMDDTIEAAFRLAEKEMVL